MAMKTADTVIPMDTLQAITDHPRATPMLRTGKEVTKDMPKLKANLARNNLLRSTVIREVILPKNFLFYNTSKYDYEAKKKKKKKKK